MNNIPRQKLIQILREHGHSLVTDPQRCKAFLLDYCGEYRSEINILMNALQEGVATELRTFSRGIPTESIMAKLRKKLEVNLAMREDAAQWAVESWALALEVISESDLSNNQGRSPSSQNPNEPITNTNQISENPPPPVQPQYRQEQIPITPIQHYSDSSTLFNQDHNTLADLKALKKAKRKISIMFVMAIIAGLNSLILPILVYINNNVFNYITETIDLILVIIFGIFSPVSVSLFNPIVDFFQPVFLLTLSFFIRKKSRLSALIFLIYVILMRLIFIVKYIDYLKTILPIVFFLFVFTLTALIYTYFCWQGVRGTFAYHKLKKAHI